MWCKFLSCSQDGYRILGVEGSEANPSHYIREGVFIPLLQSLHSTLSFLRANLRPISPISPPELSDSLSPATQFPLPSSPPDLPTAPSLARNLILNLLSHVASPFIHPEEAETTEVLLGTATMHR